VPRPKGNTKQDTVKTSIRLPRQLWKKAHVRAMDERKDLQDVIAEALAAYLKEGGK
jgi:hypothetical protein